MMTLEQDLARRRARHLYRERLVLDSPAAVEVRIDGEQLLSFCSNDYLGLANDPRVIAAMRAGAERYGAGAGASHLVSGHSRAHHALEEELADFVGAERALLFSTGYMANLGVVSALTGRHDVIFEDRLNHASLIDAARLTRAKVSRYAHADAGRLAQMLAQVKIKSPRPANDDGSEVDADQELAVSGHRHPTPPARGAGSNRFSERSVGLITTDAVFSMDGDVAPLAELCTLAARHGTRLLADDAHGFGVLGKSGRGSFEQLQLPVTPPVILMATLGKALGVFGAFVAGEAALIETLIQRARTYIYTTALPPAVAEAARASLRIVQEDGWRREHLRTLVAQFRSGAERLRLALAPSPTPIQPVMFGTAEAALRASQHLRAQGILVPAIRPPTVPEGSARLRITFSAAHEAAHVDRLLEALSAVRI